MSTPIREALELSAELHKLVDMIFSERGVFPPGMDITERQVQIATYTRGLLVSWDRNPTMYDTTELTDPLPQDKPIGPPPVRSDGEKTTTGGRRLNAHAILAKKLEGGKLSKPQFARLCTLIQHQRHMTNSQRKKLRPYNIAGYLSDIPEGVLQEFVLSEGVV